MKKTAVIFGIFVLIWAGAFCLVHFTLIEQLLADMLFDGGDANAGMVSAGAGLIIALLVLVLWWGTGKMTRRTGGAPSGTGLSPGRESPAFYRVLNESMKQIVKEFKEEIRPEEKDALYDRRKKVADFLAVLQEYRKGERSVEPVRYKSGEYPELLIEETRGILQRTVYMDYTRYCEEVDVTALEENHVDWPVFSRTLSSIIEFAGSLKGCYDFFLEVCKREKDKFVHLSEYNLLPLDVRNPSETGLYMLGEEKKMGEDFDYESVFKFGSKAGARGVSLNPGIPEAFGFLDRLITEIVKPLDILLTKGGKKLFGIYQFTAAESYRRIQHIHGTIDRIKPESLDYYIGLLREDRSDPSNCIIQYNAELSRAGLRKADLPPDILGPDDIAEMRKKLETMKENARAEGKTGSRVIYETDFFKDKDK